VYWDGREWKVGSENVHLGAGAGKNNQSETGTVAIGVDAAKNGQGSQAIAVGNKAGKDDQGEASIAIGYEAAKKGLSGASNTIAIGTTAGFQNQNSGCIAIGLNAAYQDQGRLAIAIGVNAGFAGQGEDSVAVGSDAGIQAGACSICIGKEAGKNAAAHSIVLNASGQKQKAPKSGFYVNPIAQTGPLGAYHPVGVLTYDATSHEVSTDTNKTFVIDHPTDPGRFLVHACLEGPESGVYYRGESQLTDGEVWVALPPYVSRLAHSLTVNLTQINSTREDAFARLRASHVTGQGFTVFGDPCQFAWHVFGTRNEIQSEPLRADVVVQGDGPYRYIR
jgi:hypothetical protein